MREELVIVGSGGQGVLLAGDIVAWANILMERNAVWIPLYGPAKRMGNSMCSITASDRDIYSLVVESPDTLIAMSEKSLLAHIHSVKPGGLILLNSTSSEVEIKRTDIEIITIDADTIANKLGKRRVANIVMVGAYVRRRGLIPWEKLTEGLRHVLIENGLQNLIHINVRALEEGAKQVA